tara:strand:- start:386 stop:988 length:603 start_codon:yes stop_codon:yes gene_type:complete
MLYGEYRYGYSTFSDAASPIGGEAVLSAVATTTIIGGLKHGGSLEITAVAAFSSAGQKIHLGSVEQESFPSVYGGYVYGAVDYSAPRISYPISASSSMAAAGINVFQRSAALSAASSQATSGNITAAGGSTFSAVSATVANGQLSVNAIGNVTASSGALMSGNITARGVTVMPGVATLSIDGTLLWVDILPASNTWVDAA